MEKLKMKNVIHVLGVSGSGTTMARLYHSAFARVATVTSKQLPFAKELCHSAFVRVATHCYKLCKIGQTLCLSAFARVATG